MQICKFLQCIYKFGLTVRHYSCWKFTNLNIKIVIWIKIVIKKYWVETFSVFSVTFLKEIENSTDEFKLKVIKGTVKEKWKGV